MVVSAEPVVWVNGQVLPASQATVAATDRGLMLGDGVFTTMRVTGGRPLAWAMHVARLRQSATIVDITVPIDDDTLARVCEQVVAAWGGSGDARLRITVTAGRSPAGPARTDPGAATLVVSVDDATVPLGPVALVTVPWRRNEHAPTAGAKTTSYADSVVALASARQAGADEAIMANTSGHLCECAAANVFVVLDDALVTPSLASGCLPGVTRAIVLAARCGATEATIDAAQLPRVTEAFVTSSLRGVQPVASIDGRALGGTIPGPHTLAAMAAYDAAVSGPD
jgi:branched-chain amino acid aminotransferase